MRIVPVFLVLLLACGRLASSAGAQPVPEAHRGPFVPGVTQALGFHAANLDGSSFDASSLNGTAVLLDFWAVWCAPCIAVFPKLNQLEHDFRNQGFSILGIAVYSGTHDDVSSFLEDYDVDYRVVVGEEDLAERFKVIGYPTYFLISPDGTVYKQYVGVQPELVDEIVADLTALTESKEGKESP